MRPAFVAGTFPGLQECEISLFESILPTLGPGQAVELGCCDGYSTAIILANSGFRLTSIDPMIRTPPMGDTVPSVQKLGTNIAPWFDRHALIVDLSWNISPKWATPLDFLYIDGDHDQAQRDFDEWTKFLRTGGVLAMHDYGSWSEPTRVLDEKVLSSPNWSVIGKAGWLVLARKQ
jgi:predicted O-methyltransferase YrrM